MRHQLALFFFLTKLLQLEIGIYIFVWATLQLPPDLPPLYDDFLRRFGNDVAFASLNYDLLLETIFRRNQRAWYYPLQGETKFRNEFGPYDGSFYTTSDEDPYSIPYLKLHGSFNWYYCWNCEHFSIVRDADIGSVAHCLGKDAILCLSATRDAATRILHQLAQDGQTFDQGVLAYLSPDLTAHMNRVGSYASNFDRRVPFPDYSMGLGVIAA